VTYECADKGCGHVFDKFGPSRARQNEDVKITSPTREPATKVYNTVFNIVPRNSSIWGASSATQDETAQAMHNKRLTFAFLI
jgi:hypothetical protein